MNRVGMQILDLFFPNRCDCCKQEIRFDRWICAECEEKLRKLECTPPDVWALRQNTADPFPWDGFAALYYYRDLAKTGVLSIKTGHKGFLNAMADGLSTRISEHFSGIRIDCITFVPVTKRRRRRQGYSHCELIADALGKRLGIPVEKKLLSEREGEIRQHHLNYAQRQEYSDRFVHTNRRLDGKTILLCDDIVTTGNTLRQCIGLLKECGAASVLAAVCACSAAPVPQRKNLENPLDKSGTV
ncbi:MAG: ComF family protein [Oscillospiraceae bacterium]|nr:ComF family protein [Oscillospiraceae bacterium]